MAGLNGNQGSPAAESLGDDRWRQLADRVAASAELRKATRLRELLLFLADRALRDPSTPLSEQDIGIAFFGRAPGYDTGSDTIVRVQASQLRRKLEHYFLTEGKDEPAIIEMPKGSYLPVFRPREVSWPGPAVEGQGITPAPPDAPASWYRRPTVLALVALSLICVCLGIVNLRLRASIQPLPSTPNLDRFWTQFFHNAKPAQVVLSDGGLTQLENVLGRRITLREYRDSSYPVRLAGAERCDPKVWQFAAEVGKGSFTTRSDAVVVRHLASLSGSYQTLFNVVFSRDFRVSSQFQDNVILLGHPRANPWLELIDDQLNFHYQFVFATQSASIANRKPEAQEAPEYRVRWNDTGYCVVAYVNKAGNGGNILVLFGADLPSVEAGGQFVTEERWMTALVERLHLRPGDPVPHFEVLLKTKVSLDSAYEFQIVAHRVH